MNKVLVLSIFLMLVGLGFIFWASGYQAYLIYERNGFIYLGDDLITIHWSLLGYLGLIPLGIGYLLMKHSTPRRNRFRNKRWK